MANNSSEKEQKHGPFAFVLAGISFIPLIGVLFGLICIGMALSARKANSKLLGVLGGCGILVTILIYGVILPSVMGLFGDGGLSKQFEPHAKSSMTSMVRLIEYFKLQNSRYPDSLDELRSSLKEGEMVITFDLSGPMKLGEKARDFHYEVVKDGNHYLLFSVGLDGISFTEDDVYPLIDPSKDIAIGWLKTDNSN